MMADDTTLKRARVKIKVVGIGGGGNSVLLRMAKSDFIHAQNIEDMELIAINTDAKQLAMLEDAGITCLQIGAAITHGRGTGGNLEVGEQAAKADEGRIKEALSGADLVFVTAGMGAGTGTGVVPVVSQIATIESKYQYRRMKISRFSRLCSQRNASMIRSMRRFSISSSTPSVPETQSPSSSSETTAAGFRLAADRYSHFFSAKFRVIRLTNTENRLGLCSGMAFQTAK